MTNPSITLVLFCCFLLPSQKCEALEPFTTDGCSMFPNGTISHNSLWLDCCITHDHAYWQGGTYKQRIAADTQLRDCVAGTGAVIIAEIMLEGVHLGGSPFYPTSYRWGYGWPWLRGYKPLSTEEQELVNHRLRENKIRLK